MHLSPGPRVALRRLASAGVPLLLAGALLTGCGSDGSDPAADPSPTGASSGDATGDSSSASASASPSADPATGPELSTGALTLRVPEGWKVGGNIGTLQVSADAPKGQGYLAIGKIIAARPDASVMEQAKFAARYGGGWKKGSVEIKPILSIGGEPAYHLAGIEEGLGPVDEVGLVHDGTAYTLSFTRDFGEGSEADWAEIIDSVLATAEWT